MAHRDPTDGIPIPGGPDGLTLDWLRAVLPAPAGAGIEAIAVEPLGDHVGFIGDLYRIRIERGAIGQSPSRPAAAADHEAAPEAAGRSTGDRPETVIVKPPTGDPGGRRVGTMLNVGPREVAFYIEVVPASPGVRVPHCHYAATEPDGRRWVLVLEDLAEPTEAAPGVGPRSADRGSAEAAVDALADFHARWWEADRRFDWMPGFDGRGVGGLRDAWLDAIPLFLTRYAHVVPAPTDDWLRRFAPTLPDWSAKAATEPLTIVHADMRLDNLLFEHWSIAASEADDPAPGPSRTVTMIDWQTALRGPGAMDLTSFIATSLTVDDRRRWEADLIGRYLDRLAGAGVEVDAGWFVQSYDENLLWWMGQFANNLARLEPDDPAAKAALDTMIERTYAAALDRDVGRLLS